jgi:hypothetical protein
MRNMRSHGSCFGRPKIMASREFLQKRVEIFNGFGDVRNSSKADK